MTLDGSLATVIEVQERSGDASPHSDNSLAFQGMWENRNLGLQSIFEKRERMFKNTMFVAQGNK